MKIPVIRQLSQSVTAEQLDGALAVLEAFTEARGVTEEELNVAGELITNICGAMEVQDMVNGGMKATDALNAFAQKVIGSVDKQ